MLRTNSRPRISLLGLDALQGTPLEPLQILADLLAEATHKWITALGHATQIGPCGKWGRDGRFLTAIDRITAIEDRADDAEHAFAATAVRHAQDFRQLDLFSAIGAKLEAAADALKQASLILREHVLGGRSAPAWQSVPRWLLELEVDLNHRQCRIGPTILKEADFLSLNGNIGAVHLGRLTPLTERSHAPWLPYRPGAKQPLLSQVRRPGAQPGRLVRNVIARQCGSASK
jgi:hypothetical protein